MTMLKVPIRCGQKELIANIDLRDNEGSTNEAAPMKNVDEGDASSNGNETTEADCNASSSATGLKTVGELRKFIADEVNGDPDKLKIIFRGKFIGTDSGQSLKLLDFKETDKLVVMNYPKQLIKEECAGYKALADYEKKHLVPLNQLYEKNGEDLTEIERNFLEGDMLKEMNRRMEKQLKLFTEISMRHLEALDAIQISEGSPQKEQLQRNRETRKSLIDGIQDLLNRNDKYIFRLSQYVYKIEHPDEGH